jgi:hypothetical protein
LDKNSIVVGDFNLPEIDWAMEQAGARGRPVWEAVAEQQLTQLVDFTTHLKGNTLDLIIVNCPEKVLTVCGSGRLGRSDHEKITFEIVVEISDSMKSAPRTVLNWTGQLKKTGTNLKWW